MRIESRKPSWRGWQLGWILKDEQGGTFQEIMTVALDLGTGGLYGLRVDFTVDIEMS